MFAFSLSFAATQLQIPRPEEQFHPAALAFFFATFGLVSVVWYNHCRVFHDSFAGEGIDVVLNFVLLAGVAILPYALDLATHLRGQTGVVVEACDFALIFAIYGAQNAVRSRAVLSRLDVFVLRRHAGAGISPARANRAGAAFAGNPRQPGRIRRTGGC